jgi:hypothetical protein
MGTDAYQFKVPVATIATTATPRDQILAELVI